MSEPTWETARPLTQENLENDFSDWEETPEEEFLRLDGGSPFDPDDFVEVFKPSWSDGLVTKGSRDPSEHQKELDRSEQFREFPW